MKINKYHLIETGKFRKDLKKFLKNKDFFEEINSILEILEENGVDGIPEKILPYKLKGFYKGQWECHIKPDLLMIWFQKMYRHEQSI